jgi:hypothetical protein
MTMKKLFIGIASLAFVTAAAITTVSTINANTPDSDLLTKNLEALTQNESGDGNYNWGKHPCPGWWFLNGHEECCVSGGEGNNCDEPGDCTGC